MKNEFSERLQQLLEEKKLTQADIAKGTGVAEARVSEWIRGVVKAPQRKTILRLSEYFRCNYEWLERGTGEQFPQAPQDYIARERLTGPAPWAEAPPLPESKNDEENTSIPEALDMTKEVLESKTVYRSALMSNIKAFHKAVRDEDEMKGMREEMQDIKKMLAILLERTAVEPEQKREAQAGGKQ